MFLSEVKEHKYSFKASSTASTVTGRPIASMAAEEGTVLQVCELNRVCLLLFTWCHTVIALLVHTYIRITLHLIALSY